MNPFKVRTQNVFWILLVVVVFTACARQQKNSQQAVPGKTTESELRQALGEPVQSVVPSVRPQAKILEYADGSGHQIESDTVVSSYREPTQEETSLQYWKHRFKGHGQKNERIQGTKDPHGQSLYRYSAPEMGIAVIYDRQLDRVIRVVTYGAR